MQTYEESLKSYRDLKNSLDTAFEEGRAKEKRQVVKSSIKAGLKVDLISTITGMPPEEIERIKNEG